MKQRMTQVSYGRTHDKQNGEYYEQFESALVKHDKYLIELEKQKKLSKNLYIKDKVQQEREKKEQGFSLYVNGANAVSKPTPTWSKKNNIKTKPKLPLINDGFVSPRKNVKSRLNTAPESTRKFWGQGSVEIATDSGVKLCASVGALSHMYSDDFEESIDFEDASESDFPKRDDRKPIDVRPKSVPVPQRKYWGQGSVSIKASSGDLVRASISNIKQFDYSMDFEDCSDGTSSESEAEEIEEEIDADSLDESDNQATIFFGHSDNNATQNIPNKLTNINNNIFKMR